ncbi:MAG: transglutaminase family protein [Cyanobacteriota/Melainabacteria group bacterium]
MKYRIQHLTSYHYSEEVDLGPHIVRLRPAVHAKSKVLSYSLTVKPDCQIRWQYDPWNNLIARLAFPPDRKFQELSLCVDATVEIKPINPFDFYVESWCEQLPFDYPEAVQKELLPFLEKPEGGALFNDFIKKFPLEGALIDFLVNLNATVFKTISYEIRHEPGIQTSEETLARGAGSCRDTALLTMEILRSLGFAARFVSGYLLQEVEEEMKLDLHAWTEVYVPGAGWVGLDGTSGLLCAEGHIPLACTVTAEQAAPVFGTASGAAVRFDVHSNVSVVGDETSPDRPYSDDTWRNILKVGDSVDTLLESTGTVLTSGGEPTFTAVDDDARQPEWFLAALGRSKRVKAACVLEHLYERFGEGPLPIFGTGKLYPGEDDPRWALTLLWRVDGEPIWLNKDLLDFKLTSDEQGEVDADDTESGLAKAREFLEALSEKLSIEPNIIPGYEDPVHLVVAEENLPCEEELGDLANYCDLDDRDERKRLSKILDRGAGTPVGLALPLTRLAGNWYSQGWKFKRDHMYLVPGRSPMGLRLPLHRIKSDIEADFVRDPSVEAGALPKRSELLNNADEAEAANGDEKSDLPVTALCIEPHGDSLGVFLPPLSAVDDYLALIEAVEEAAVISSVRIRIEGYPPPPDSRVRSLSLTPDPGVLEANMPVCESLRQYARALEFLADSTGRCGLGLEKYQLDGRTVGTGGGHHITLGGPSTLESPFIQHPHLLASMVRYFQNHPSLSFFFTGLFVGPHSQAPRIDEARQESLYELELALAQFPMPLADQNLDSNGSEDPQPWLTDRLLRNILVDVTGNTHRAEICIDKLYNPESQTGRLGLVELRAFEMPPHHQMAVVQMLLIRSLICRFLLSPYREKLIHWSDALHDKFMLPHFLLEDLLDVLRDLQDHGIELQAEWFKPFLDFRFPLLGTMNLEKVRLELRVAHEPWYVLSVMEDSAQRSTLSRPVDSSMERLQIRVSNLNAERHKLLVNGVEMPLVSVGPAGEYIAAVRFRAWQPPNCLHPNIEVHHPLRFEVLDSWSKRSLGACQYHVVHPEGKLYEEPPLTRHDASARVYRRFVEGNHTPWPVEYRAVTDNGAGSVTLDLRLY